MRLFSSRRARAVLLVLSLLGVGRETVLPHECATMAASAVATSTQSAHDHGAHEHGAPAGHDHASADASVEAPVHAPADAPSGHECDCIGECCCVPVATLALGRAEPLPPLALHDVATSAVATDERLPVAPRYLRPFAIGPPAVIAA
jgi:hypothetical protein